MVGTSASSLTKKVNSSDILAGPSGSFSATVGSLNPNTTYYYKAYMTVWNGTKYVDIESAIGTFTTTAQGTVTQPGWLELPVMTSGSDIFNGSFGSGKNRNYSYHFDASVYTALWTAYPLTSAHTSGSASTTTWNFNPYISEEFQINVKANSYQTNYGNSKYNRGHLLPAADRKCDGTMRTQTYYLSNQTPQLESFNSPLWSNLETTVRNLTSSTDTVYVVTGAAFRKVGGSEKITYLTAAKDDIYPTSIPVPNYFWKVLLKVKRSGSTVTSACAIGIWMPHQEYSSSTEWQSHVVSVNKIEEWTGFDFFTNLPGTESSGIEMNAETNSNWSTFQDF